VAEAPRRGEKVAGGKVYDVTRRDDGKWQVQRADASRPARITKTKEEAVAAGRKLARRSGPSQLRIHLVDGHVQIVHSYR
jgi:hypothetical protein